MSLFFPGHATPVVRFKIVQLYDYYRTRVRLQIVQAEARVALNAVAYCAGLRIVLLRARLFVTRFSVRHTDVTGSLCLARETAGEHEQEYLLFHGTKVRANE